MDKSPSPHADRCQWLLQAPGINFQSLQVHASLNQRSLSRLKGSQMDSEIPGALAGSQSNFRVSCHFLEVTSGLSSLFPMLENQVLSGKRQSNSQNKIIKKKKSSKVQYQLLDFDLNDFICPCCLVLEASHSLTVSKCLVSCFFYSKINGECRMISSALF